MPTLYVRNPYRQLARRNVWDAIKENNSEEPKIVFPMDVQVSENDYRIEAFLPGVNVEDLDIQIENNVVIIKGEIKIETNEDVRYLVKERPAGIFQRAIELPDDVDADNIEAELKNGVLTLNLPKSELAKPRKIKISNN
ncbi:MAG TPA: Hsp20/alpha crystallin family protein [Anaerolineaceae bacterium]|nr:Hsp20/alpha crystallin family protein [Anaerolineaceae bacterium]